MFSSQEEKIKKIFANAKHFAVVSDNKAREEILLAREALGAAIKNANLPVNFSPEKEKEFEEKWLSILPAANNNSLAFSTSILIPKNKTGIQEVSYTEDSRHISINISANEEILKENIIFKNLPTKIDALFYFSSSDQERLSDELSEELSKKIILPETDNIIIVASSADGETVAEKVSGLIQAIEPDGDLPTNNSSVSDIVLASLLIETDQFQKNFSEKSLNLAASLIKLGADKEKIIGLINDKNPSFVRLLGRALARSYPNESLKSVWTFIAAQDLEKTGTTANLALLGKIMKKIKGLLDPHPFFVLVWQSKNEVWAMISARISGDEALEKIRIRLSAKKENGDLVSGPYKNFSEAELKIQGALKEVA